MCVCVCVCVCVCACVCGACVCVYNLCSHMGSIFFQNQNNISIY